MPHSDNRKGLSARARLLSLVALLAFLFQGLVVQTHIHGQPALNHGVAVSQPASSPASDDPFDPASCPLCQELTHGGVFTAPPPALLILLLAVAFTSLIFQTPSLVRQTRRQGWQSRAPPRR